MRRASFLMLSLWLAGCVALQPVAQAMGACCAPSSGRHASDPAEAAAAVAPPMQHMQHRTHPHHHEATVEAPHAKDGKSASCGCACDCGMAGCAGGAPGLAVMENSHAPMQGSVDYIATDPTSRRRPGHGLDLIRPPSTS